MQNYIEQSLISIPDAQSPNDLPVSTNDQSERTAYELQAGYNAIVVGASSGIGYQIAIRLLNDGYNVVNISRTPCSHPKVRNVLADVTVTASLVSAIQTAFGDESVDLLIYSAGASLAAPLVYTKESDLRYLFEVNYFGAVHAVQAVFESMKSSGGKIILISSMAGVLPIYMDSLYSSSKSALNSLAKDLSAEFSAYDIQVCSVVLGGVATDFTYKRRVYDDCDSKEYARDVKKSSAALANMEQGGADPALVAQDVCRLIQRDRIPAVYVSGFKNKMIYLAHKILPESVVLFLNKKAYHLQ